MVRPHVHPLDPTPAPEKQVYDHENDPLSIDGLCPRCYAPEGEPHDRHCPESLEDQAERAAEMLAEMRRDR